MYVIHTIFVTPIWLSPRFLASDEDPELADDFPFVRQENQYVLKAARELQEMDKEIDKEESTAKVRRQIACDMGPRGKGSFTFLCGPLMIGFHRQLPVLLL